jgi:hypothetical protein
MKTFVQAIIPRNSHPNQPIKAIFLFKQDFGYIKVFILDVQFYKKNTNALFPAYFLVP